MAKGRKSGGRDFKPGNNANPTGRPALPPEVRAFRKLTLAELQGYISQIKDMPVSELEDLARSKDIPALKAWIYSMAAQGIRSGSERAFDSLMDRLVGRVADQLNIRATVEKELKGKTEAELMDEARALLSAMEAQKK